MSKKIISILLTFQVILVFVQFIFSLGRATDGDRLFELESQIDQLSKQNSQLSDKLLDYSKISNIENYARSSGYIPQTIIGLEPLPVAVRIDVP